LKKKSGNHVARGRKKGQTERPNTSQNLCLPGRGGKSQHKRQRERGKVLGKRRGQIQTHLPRGRGFFNFRLLHSSLSPHPSRRSGQRGLLTSREKKNRNTEEVK